MTIPYVAFSGKIPPMKAGPWQLPPRLIYLIESGYWPTQANAQKQNLNSPVPKEVVQKWAPEEDAIFFNPPPFLTVKNCTSQGEAFWSWPMASPEGISPTHSVVIGDFGLGSDAPIILDYRADSQKPEVKRLKWGLDVKDNVWITAARSFDEMCDSLRLPAPNS